MTNFLNCVILIVSFFLQYIRYLESLKAENIDKIRDVYARACKVHHPKKPNLHMQWATFEESQNDYDRAASILENIDTVIPNMLQVAYRRINLERRRGDLETTCTLYEHYISTSKNRTIANNIVVKYARFLCKIKNETDRAVKVLLKVKALATECLCTFIRSRLIVRPLLIIFFFSGYGKRQRQSTIVPAINRPWPSKKSNQCPRSRELHGSVYRSRARRC